jgi:L-rhamnose 1-dehydrogenase
MGTQEPRVVLVTGSSRGIGRATAVSFAETGARVVINHPGEPVAAAEAERLVRAAGGEPLVIAADVGVPADVRRMVDTVIDRWGYVDVLVLNAGICPLVPFLDTDEALWDRVHSVNLKGAFLTAQAVARHMIERGKGGRIIGISSVSAWTGGAEQVAYCPTKAGMSALMRVMAISLGPHGITCNAVLPGEIETDINREDLAMPGKREYMEGRIPLRRVGEPRDVADLVRLLAEEGARYVNGAEIVVDGGLLVNLEGTFPNPLAAAVPA